MSDTRPPQGQAKKPGYVGVGAEGLRTVSLFRGMTTQHVIIWQTSVPQTSRAGMGRRIWFCTWASIPPIIHSKKPGSARKERNKEKAMSE